MSNSLAIAAVTSTIRFLLERAVQQDADLASTVVTTKPPGTARGNLRGKQLNVFLYEVRPNAAFWNGDPRAPGALAPLALNLYYLVTAYADDLENEEAISQQILGRALSTLHDHPLLGAAEIQNALAGSELENQVERVRLTFQVLTNEDIWKLWSAFQTPFRLSAAYEASVVVIDSVRPAPAALPVLRRGSEDRGVQAMAAPTPSLEGVLPVASPARPVAQLGDDLLVTGQGLDSPGALVRLVGPAEIPVHTLVPGAGGTATQLRVHLPSATEEPDLSRFTPGVYRLMLVVGGADQPRWTTNEIPLRLAPVIDVAPLTAPAGDLQLTVTCRPRLRPGQRVLLLLGDRQVLPETLTTPADPAQPSRIVFTAADVAAGAYVVRLRVDGVDSLPIVAAGTPPRLHFDPAQTVTVT